MEVDTLDGEDKGARRNRLVDRFLRHWPLLAMLLLALAVRLVVNRDMWIDEITSIMQANTYSILDTLVEVPVVHPPLYHILLHVWIGFFGLAEPTVRLFSILTGLAAVAAMYFLGLRFFGRRPAIVAALFTTLSPFHIWYSQEVRMYALLFFLATLSLYFFMLLLEDRRLRVWLAWAVVTGLAAYDHYTGLLLGGLEILFALAYWGLGGGRQISRKALKQWIGVTAAMTVVTVPLGLFFLSKANSFDYTTWLAPSTARQSFAVAMATVSEIFLGYHSTNALARLGAMWPLLMYVGPIAILGYRRVFETKTRLLAWIAVATFVILGFAAYLYPLFNPRYLTIGVPPLLMLLANAMVRPDNKLRIWLLVLVVALFTVSAADQTLGGKNALRYENRAAMEYLAASLGEKDQVIYTPPYMYLVFNYYLYTPEPRPVFAAPEPGLFVTGQYRNLHPLISRLVAGKDRTFFVYSFKDQDPRVGLAIKRISRQLDRAYPKHKLISFSNIWVICYSRRDDCPTREEAELKASTDRSSATEARRPR